MDERLVGCTKCLKYSVFISNFIFWILGVAMLCVALWLRFDRNSEMYVQADKNELDEYYVAVYFLIGAGAIITLVGFLGCCGAYQESRCMLATFFIFMLLVIAAQIAGATYAFVNHNKFEKTLNATLVRTIKDHYITSAAKTAAIDWMQRTLECCGGRSYNDFNDNVQWINMKEPNSMPSSCCPVSPCLKIEGSKSGSVSRNLYTMPCGVSFMRWLRYHLIAIILTGLVLALFEIIGLIMSLALCCFLQRRDRLRKNPNGLLNRPI